MIEALTYFSTSNVEAIRTDELTENTINELIQKGYRLSQNKCCLTSPGFKGVQSCRYCDERWEIINNFIK